LAAGSQWDPQSERYFGPSGIRRGPLDLNLVNLILTRAGPESPWLEEATERIARRALAAEPVDLLCPAYGQIVAMDESTLEACGFHRSRRSTSSFVIVLAEAASVVLDLSYRTPDAAASSVVHVGCAGQTVARLPASAAWKCARVKVPASALAPGINFLDVGWPQSVLDGREILARYADALAFGESPVAPYPVLGEIFTLRASL
jgi:hypothetical protein